MVLPVPGMADDEVHGAGRETTAQDRVETRASTRNAVHQESPLPSIALVPSKSRTVVTSSSGASGLRSRASTSPATRSPASSAEMATTPGRFPVRAGAGRGRSRRHRRSEAPRSPDPAPPAGSAGAPPRRRRPIRRRSPRSAGSTPSARPRTRRARPTGRAVALPPSARRRSLGAAAPARDPAGARTPGSTPRRPASRGPRHRCRWCPSSARSGLATPGWWPRAHRSSARQPPRRRWPRTGSKCSGSRQGGHNVSRRRPSGSPGRARDPPGAAGPLAPAPCARCRVPLPRVR